MTADPATETKTLIIKGIEIFDILLPDEEEPVKMIRLSDALKLRNKIEEYISDNDCLPGRDHSG